VVGNNSVFVTHTRLSLSLSLLSGNNSVFVTYTCSKQRSLQSAAGDSASDQRFPFKGVRWDRVMRSLPAHQLDALQEGLWGSQYRAKERASQLQLDLGADGSF
ncbi:unnamed protein product, partial [Ectocarpus sp. 8 AP-2014]